MHTQAHADRSVDDLSRNPVLVHIRNPRLAAISSLANIREPDFFCATVAFRDRKTGAVNKSQGNRTLHAVDDKGVRAIGLFHDARGDIAVFGFDIVDITIGRLTHMAVG